MKLVYDALTGKVTQEPDDEREQAPQAPERKVTLKERIAALKKEAKETGGKGLYPAGNEPRKGGQYENMH